MCEMNVVLIQHLLHCVYFRGLTFEVIKKQTKMTEIL